MTILFTGGGTMGPVTPLLAVLRQMKKRKPGLQFAWAGTPDGPERVVVEKEGVRFYPIPVAKLPRYPSLSLLIFPFRMAQARRAADHLLQEEKPEFVVSAGGFTSVPVIQAAAKQGIPCAIHQLDAEPGLANVTVAGSCASVTTSFSYDFPPFKNVTSEQMPTPCRFAESRLLSRENAARLFRLDPARPIVFIVGGGTGAKAINEAIWKRLEDWQALTQVIHLTGTGKRGDRDARPALGVICEEFFDESQMLQAYAASDLVISRAGIGGISEIAALARPAIFVPIPRSHQEQNVRRLPCAVTQQGGRFEERLLNETRRLLNDPEARNKLAESVHAAFRTDNGSALAERWMTLLS